MKMDRLVQKSKSFLEGSCLEDRKIWAKLRSYGLIEWDVIFKNQKIFLGQIFPLCRIYQGL